MTTKLSHPPIRMKLRMGKRIAHRYEPNPETGCWEWLLYKTSLGYGKSGGKQAHRAVYEELIGPIPEGMDLDHLCRNPSCVNPEHLEPVTPFENKRRRHLRPAKVNRANYLNPLPKLCSVEGCDRKHYAKSWCSVHYARWRTHGDPLLDLLRVQPDDAHYQDRLWARFWDKVQITESCWLWQGAMGAGTTPSFKWHGGFSAVAFIYSEKIGLIPSGHALARTCANTRCVNPEHVLAVLHGQHSKFSPRWSGNVDVCINGHPFDEENTYWRREGGRACRACRRERSRLYRLRQKEKTNA